MSRRFWMPFLCAAAALSLWSVWTSTRAASPAPASPSVSTSTKSGGYIPPAQTPLGLISAGTEGKTLSTPPQNTGPITIAVVGQLAPAFPDNRTSQFTTTAIKQLQLLRPDMVFSLGNLIPGTAAGESAYAAQVSAQQKNFDPLPCPWYPLAGETDLAAALPQTRPAAPLYQKLQGPRYYSVDNGDLHVIALDTQEPGGISNEQLAWLKNDLVRAFEGTLPRRRGRWVLVLAHRPLWRMPKTPEGDSWSRVQQELVRFNQKPVVSVEGAGSGGGQGARAPRAVAVIASGRAYSQEPPQDDIRYYIAPPCAALPAPGLTDSTALRALMILKLQPDAPDPDGFHVSLLNLAPAPPLADAFLPDNIITARTREALDAIAQWNDAGTLQCDGFIDIRRDTAAKLIRVHMGNPLKEPIDISLHLADGQPWRVSPSEPITRHLNSGANEAWDLSFAAEGAGETPPHLLCTIQWHDPQQPDARPIPVTLERLIPVAARIDIPVQSKLDPARPIAADAPMHVMANWHPSADQPHKTAPTWQINADASMAYLRVHVHVQDADHTFNGPDPAQSDAVTFAWAAAANQSPHEITIFPFGPTQPQTLLDGKPDTTSAIHPQIAESPQGYDLTIPILRTLLSTIAATQPQTILMNLTITGKDAASPTPLAHSISPPQSSPATWTQLRLIPPPAAAAGENHPLTNQAP